MNYRDIPSSCIKELYDTDMSYTVLSQITDKVIPDIKAWQSRIFRYMVKCNAL